MVTSPLSFRGVTFGPDGNNHASMRSVVIWLKIIQQPTILGSDRVSLTCSRGDVIIAARDHRCCKQLSHAFLRKKTPRRTFYLLLLGRSLAVPGAYWAAVHVHEVGTAVATDAASAAGLCGLRNLCCAAAIEAQIGGLTNHVKRCFRNAA